MPKSKEELAKGKADLLAKETALKKEWCTLEGHRWDLPSVSPFNHDILECAVICNRCNAHATVTVTIDDDAAVARPAPSATVKASK
jgi:hypothetical protein